MKGINQVLLYHVLLFEYVVGDFSLLHIQSLIDCSVGSNTLRKRMRGDIVGCARCCSGDTVLVRRFTFVAIVVFLLHVADLLWLSCTDEL